MYLDDVTRSSATTAFALNSMPGSFTTENPLPRFAFVNGGLGPGGATTFLCNLGGELVRRGVPVLVLGLDRENVFAKDFAALNVPVVTQDERSQIIEDRIQATLEAIAQFKATVLVGCLGSSSFELLRYAPRGVTRVAMVHADYPMHYHAAAPYGPYVDALVGVSEQIRQTLASMPQFAGRPSYFLTCGVAVPEAFTPRRPTPGQPLRILYLGRLERQQKRVNLFPQILQQLVESGISFTWTIVGEGPDAEFLSQTMKTERSDQQVRLVGRVPYSEVPEFLRTHDILLLTSMCEGLPLCVLEGMAYGQVPVVTNLESGIRELLNQSNGRPIELEDVRGYAEAMVKLYRDPDTMEKLSRNARITIEREFSTQVMAQRWIKTFPPAPGQVEWPRRWRVHGPLNGGWQFSLPVRVARRLARRLRNDA